jgi:hypothetical protein
VRDTLLQLPRSRNSKRFEGKSIQELVALEPDNTIAVSTVNNNLTNISSFLTWCKDEQLIPHNPAHRLKIKEEKPETEHRSPYTTKDLENLFHAPQYVEDTFLHPSDFWCPILSLFTGARREDVSQLHVEDVRQEEGLWMLDVNKKRNVHGFANKKLKNPSAKRHLPLHPFLVETLRFPEFVRQQAEKGHLRVFPELVKIKEKYGHKLGERFSCFNNSIDLEEAPPEMAGLLLTGTAKVGIGHIPPSWGMSCGHFDVVTGFGVEPGPFVPSRVLCGLPEGFHGPMLVGRLKARVLDIHVVEPFMAVAVQGPSAFLLGETAQSGRIGQLFLPLVAHAARHEIMNPRPVGLADPRQRTLQSILLLVGQIEQRPGPSPFRPIPDKQAAAFPVPIRAQYQTDGFHMDLLPEVRGSAPGQSRSNLPRLPGNDLPMARMRHTTTDTGQINVHFPRRKNPENPFNKGCHHAGSFVLRISGGRGGISTTADF